MRASHSHIQRRSPVWAFAVAASLAMGMSGALVAQESGEAVAPVPPVPPVPKVAPAPEEKVTKQVRIVRQEDGSLRIHARDENGESANVEINLGEEFGGAVTRRIYEKLEEKGILDDKGLVVDEALESVPRNIEIGIKAEMERAERARERAERARERAERDFHVHEIEQYRPRDMEWLIGLFAILGFFGMPILIVWLVTRNSYRKAQLKTHALGESINRMVSEGRDIPQELLDSLQGAEPTAVTKDRGFTLIAVGAAIFIWLTAAGGLGAGSLGLIPLFIGVARFINWKLDQQQQVG